MFSIVGSFTLGCDYDTPDIFDKTDEFIRESEIDFPSFHVLTPFPGTPLFNRLENTTPTEGKSLH